MRRITAVLAAEHADSGRIVDTAILSFAARRAERGLVTGLGGARYQLDLPAPVTLRMGDLLVLDDGGLVEVVAEAEPLIEARAKDLEALARVAWHLGDRHVPVEILPNRLRLRRDAAIETLLTKLGARLVAIEAAFNPEGGAYLAAAPGAPGHDHRQDHHHDHDHGHGHDHADDHHHSHNHDHRSGNTT
ncbi:MAG: urease accessory protein UreE [Xanthobacteraceae bacterium]|jgi:urease accessory protein